jgi:hypothetical protein
MSDGPQVEEVEPNHCDNLYCVYSGKLQCERCKNVYYCSQMCQKDCWMAHKFYCKHPEREKVVDGYRVCDTILKCNDFTHTYLAGKVFDRLEVTRPEHVVEAIDAQNMVEKITIHNKLNKEGDQFKAVDGPRFYLEEGAPILDGLKAYWAQRSITSSFSLNDALCVSLKKYREKGFTILLFGRLELSLDQSLKMDVISVSSSIGVEIRDPQRQQPFSRVSMFPFLTLDGFSITLSAGAYWYFDHNNRPLLIAPCSEFVKPLGVLVGADADDKDVKSASDHKKRMFRKEHIASRTATILYFSNYQFGLDRDLSKFRHLATSQIQTQRDKLKAAKMMNKPAFEETIAKFIKRGGTISTDQIKAFDQECREEEERLAAAITTVESVESGAEGTAGAEGTNVTDK